MEFLRLIDTFHQLNYVKHLSEKLEFPQANQATTTITKNHTDNVSISSTKRSSVNFDILTKDRKRLKTPTEQPKQSLVDYSDSDSNDDEVRHSEEDTDIPSLRRGP